MYKEVKQPYTQRITYKATLYVWTLYNGLSLDCKSEHAQKTKGKKVSENAYIIAFTTIILAC